MNPSPLESQEQVVFIQWLELIGLRFTAIPMSTYTKSFKQKAFNRAQGVRAGFPDLVVLIPPTRARDGLGHLLCPEMKRRQGGTVSAVQKDWIAALNGLGTPNIEARVCKGAQEAMDFVNEHLKPGPTSPF